MKKHNEGYVLPFVLVVMAVLGIVAASVLSFSLKNLQNQQKSIERMQDKYKAQGAIEIIVSQLCQDFDPVEYEGDVEEAVKTAIDDKIQGLCSAYNEETASPTAETSPEAPEDGTVNKSLVYTLTLESIYNTVKIACELELSVEYEYTEETNSDTTSTTEGATNSENTPNPTVVIHPQKIEYKSYETSNINPSDEHSVAIPTETTGGGGAG